jgi:hypothetical protein
MKYPHFVGFSVDFSAHICHAYLSSSLRDKGSRVKEALELARIIIG